MRAFWIVVLGLAGAVAFVSTASASKIEYSKKELDDYCNSKAGTFRTSNKGWSCDIGTGDSAVHIACGKNGNCVMYKDLVLTKPPARANVFGKSVAASAQISGGGGLSRPATASGTDSAVVSSGAAGPISNATFAGGKSIGNTSGAGKALNGRPAFRQQ